jgi:hypothetical protein
MRKFTSFPTPADDEQILAATGSFWQSRSLTVVTEVDLADLITSSTRRKIGTGCGQAWKEASVRAKGPLIKSTGMALPGDVLPTEPESWRGFQRSTGRGSGKTGGSAL